MDDDTEATAQASRGANELIAASSEVVEEAGSSQSMSEEEGVSRGAEVRAAACTYTTCQPQGP